MRIYIYTCIYFYNVHMFLYMYLCLYIFSIVIYTCKCIHKSYSSIDRLDFCDLPCAAHMTWVNMNIFPDCLMYFRFSGQRVNAFLLRVWGKTQTASGMPEASFDYSVYGFWILVMAENTKCISESCEFMGGPLWVLGLHHPSCWHTSMSKSSIRCRKEMDNPIESRLDR